MARNAFCFALCVTFAVTSAAEDAKGLAADASKIFSDLAKSQLGLDNMKSSIDSFTFKAATMDGKNFVEEIAKQTTDKLKKRMTELQKSREVVVELYKKKGESQNRPDAIQCCAVPEDKTRFDARFNKKIMTKQMCQRSPQGDGNFPSVLETLEGKVIRSSEFQKYLSDNFEKSPNTKWAYFGGNEHGLFGQYPAGVGDPTECALFDPRFRPWYVASASIAKNVVVMIDTGSGMSKGNRTRAKKAAKTVLDTLSGDDSFTVLKFDSQAKIRSSTTKFDACVSKQLVTATPENVNTMLTWMNEDDTPNGPADFVKAFDKAFDLLDATFKASPGLKTRPTTILFLSDTEAPSPVATITKRRAAAFTDTSKLLIFTFSFGDQVTQTTKDTLKAIADMTSSANVKSPYTHVGGADTAGELRTKMASYFSDSRLRQAGFESEPLKEHVLSVPYSDAAGLGLIVTLAAPVRVLGELKGVVGVDLMLSDLLDDVSKYAYTTTDSYAFVADSQGRVLAHPNLPEPEHWSKKPIFLHVDELEQPHGNSADYVKEFMTKASGSMAAKWKRSHARGDTGDGLHTKEVTGTFFWATTSTGLHTRTTNTGGELRIGYFFADTDKNRQNVGAMPNVDTATQKLNYHRVDLAPFKKMCCAYGPCNDADVKKRGKIVAPSETAVSFAPRLYKHPVQYTGLKEGQREVTAVNKVLNTATADDLKNARMNAQAIYEARASLGCHAFWKKSILIKSDIKVARRYMGTKGGVFSINPAQIVPKGYDSQRRSWYIRAEQNKDSFSLSKTVDPFKGNAGLLTLSKSLANKGDSKETFAVMGIDFSTDDLKKALNAKRGEALKGAKIYLVDAYGFVLLNLEGENKAEKTQYVSEVNAAVAKTLLKKNTLATEECANYQTNQVETHYKIKVKSISSLPCKDSGSVAIEQVPNTQAFLVVDSDCKDDSTDYVCDGKCPAAGESKKSVCPCDTALGYFICKETSNTEGAGRFETRAGLSVCGQTPFNTFFTTDYESKNVISTGAENLRNSLSPCDNGAAATTAAAAAGTTSAAAGTTADEVTEEKEKKDEVSGAVGQSLATIAAILLAIVV